ncbi:MAG: response regulator transcription factor [Spirochaetaceae bacterium]|jgi:DNA-binding NarL/FixJ family response regulator|nr:response regulator transcription factor [Spirochaetaceae bacterium]
MIRIVVVSGFMEERERIHCILRQWPEFDILGLGKDAYDALQFARSSRPDVMLIDENPHILDCPKIVSAFRRWSPKTRVIILADSGNNQAVFKSILNGAAGYLLKGRDAEIVSGINWVYLGGMLMNPRIASRVFRYYSERQTRLNQEQITKMTRKEMRVLACIGKGFSNREIATELQLKNGTVRNYISMLLQKTGLRNRTEIALHVHDTGLFDNDNDGRERYAFSCNGQDLELAEYFKTLSLHG